MKRIFKVYRLMLIMTVLMTVISTAQIKWAQTGFNFLEVSTDARAGAMGDAVNSIIGNLGAMSHNPATMTEMPGAINATFGINYWIADIKYVSGSIILSPHFGDYGVIGISVQSVDYGEVLGTMVWNNDAGYINTETLNPSALAIGLAYAKAITDRFSVGGQVRFAYQSLGKSVVPDGNGLKTKQNVANVTSFDFGTLFKTGIKSIAFGMSVRNFSREVTYEQESFQLPLIFTVGISANVLDFLPPGKLNHSLLVGIDVTHPRAHPEQLKIGAEYKFMNLIALRCGYITNDSEDGITYGFGVLSKGLGISSANLEIGYAYTPFGVFGNAQRLTLSILM